MKHILTTLTLATLAPALLATGAHAQLAINEANATSEGNFLDVDLAKPYEGFDFGIVPHSGNNNSPTAMTNPGNPFPDDVDAGTAGNQTTLPNGWDGSTGFGRIDANGGDWLELVVTEDMADLRGWTLYWENDDVDSDGDPFSQDIGEVPDERGFIQFSADPVWQNVRSGTIITLSEDASRDEVRDEFPNAAPLGATHDTGFDFDLSTDTRFDPIANGTPDNPGSDADWHRHFHVDESVTDNGQPTQFFEAFSDIKVDNDDMRFAIFDDSNTSITDDALDGTKGRDDLDLSTGLIGQFLGESANGYGDNTGAGGLNGQEALALIADLSPDATGLSADYEDVDFSTFSTENLFNDATEDTLDGVQDFSALRQWLADVEPGDANFDGEVDEIDEAIVQANFGQPGQWADGDFNNDGIVDEDDLAIFAPSVVLGDLDGNGVVDGLDIDPFVQLLTSGDFDPAGDFDTNGTIDGLDIDPFVGALTGDTATTTAQSIPEPTSLVLLMSGALLLRRRRGM